MADNIYDVFRSEQSALISVLDENHDVCTFLKGAYDHLLDLTMNLGRKAEDLDLQVSIIQERLLKIDISWKNAHEGASRLNASKIPYQRNMSLASFVRSNPKVRNLAHDVIYILQRWLKEKEYRKDLGYSQIKIENAIGWRDGRTITGEIVLKVEYEQMTRERLGLSKAEPEQPVKSDIILTDDMMR